MNVMMMTMLMTRSITDRDEKPMHRAGTTSLCTLRQKSYPLHDCLQTHGFCHFCPFCQRSLMLCFGVGGIEHHALDPLQLSRVGWAVCPISHAHDAGEAPLRYNGATTIPPVRVSGRDATGRSTHHETRRVGHAMV